MKKKLCYLKTPRDLIKAEKILLDAGIEVLIRPAPEAVFGLCNMAIDIKNNDEVYIVTLLEAAGLPVIIKETEE